MPYTRQPAGTFATLLLLAVGLAICATPSLCTGDSPATTRSVSSVPVKTDQFRGIWLQVHNNSPDCPYEGYVREIAATGANAVCMSISAEQENAASTEIHADLDRVPSPERLIGLIRLAKSLDKKVVFMPIVLLTRPAGSDEWRGTISPKDWRAWWDSYTKYIVNYAALCQENGVDLFMVGSELISTERSEAEWRELIKQVRAKCREVLDIQFRDYLKRTFPAYAGEDFRQQFGIDDIDSFVYSAPKDVQPREALVALYRRFSDRRRMLLSYSANWDHYTVPKFWDALDAVGMTSYYDLNTDEVADPPLESLIKAWQPIKAEIAEWQRKIGKPIIFTEVGWASQDGCSIEPWNYYHSEEPDLVEQQRCTESFLRTFAGEPWICGVLIWKWRDTPGITGDMTDKDEGRLGYTPYGKPVLKTIEQFFASPEAKTPAASLPTSPLRTTSPPATMPATGAAGACADRSGGVGGASSSRGRE